MKIINTNSTQIYEGVTNENQVIDRLTSVVDTEITANKALSFSVPANQTDYPISLADFTPTKFISFKANAAVGVRLATAGTQMTSVKQFAIYGGVSELLVTTGTAAVEINVVVAK